MGHISCLICCQPYIKKHCEREINEQNSESLSNTAIPSSEECETVKNQLKVIFLLRKLLQIPENMCCKFLEDYGDPYTWINCCDSCSQLANKAQDIFDKILLLEKQFEKAQIGFKMTVVSSENSKIVNENVNVELKCGPKEIVRSYIYHSFGDSVISQRNTIKIEANFDVEPNCASPPSADSDFGLESIDCDAQIQVMDSNYENAFLESDEDEVYKPDPTRRKTRGKAFQNTVLDEDDSEDDNDVTYGDDEDSPHRCKTCGKRFSKVSALTRHENTHSGERPFECEYKNCLKRFKTASGLKDHTLIHTGEKPFECEYCKKCFSLATNLRKHVRVHTGEKPFQCKMCSQRFSQCGNFKSHLRRHHGIEHSEIITTKEVKDSKNEPKDKRVSCTVCGKMLATASGLKDHMLIHSGEKPYQCDRCEKCFSLATNLRKHLRVHTGEKPFKCDICDKNFVHAGNLKGHLKSHHGIPPATESELSSKKPKRPRNTKGQLYECEFCSKQFKSNSHLTVHIRVHTGERPFKCDTCSKCFRKQHHLKEHVMVVHDGHRPVICEICGKGHVSKSMLNKHMRIHTGEKPFKCEICGRTFAQHGNLRAHKLTHEGDRPYICDQCGKRFTTALNLKLHARIHTGANRNKKCNMCDKVFTKTMHLNKHKAKIHNIGVVVEQVQQERPNTSFPTNNKEENNWELPKSIL